MRIAIGVTNQGFRLSELAISMLKAKIGEFNEYDDSIEFRSNPELIAVIEELGKDAAAEQEQWGTPIYDFPKEECPIKIVDVPDDAKVYIAYSEDYSGPEYVCEEHRTWN